MPTQTQFPFLPKGRSKPEAPDVCRNKHQDSDESRAANEQTHARKADARQRVYLDLLESLRGGLTCRELSELQHKPMHAISGRITELVAAGQAFKTGRTREGGRVIVADKYAF